MISIQTLLKVKDNSGAKIAQCIKTYNRGSKASIGDIILISVKKLKKKIKIRGKTKVSKGNIFKALVIRTAFKTKNIPGNMIKFDENSIILLNNQGQALATRIFGPITRILRKKKKLKILIISSTII